MPWSNQVDRDLEAAASEIDPKKRPRQLTIYDKHVIARPIGADGINANWADLWLDRVQKRVTLG